MRNARFFLINKISGLGWEISNFGPRKKSTVEEHRKALRIAYNPDASFSVGRDEKCGFCLLAKRYPGQNELVSQEWGISPSH